MKTNTREPSASASANDLNRSGTSKSVSFCVEESPKDDGLKPKLTSPPAVTSSAFPADVVEDPVALAIKSGLISRASAESSDVSPAKSEHVSALKIERPKFVHCEECKEDIPAEDWPNHRDRLRTVELKKLTLSAIQRYILNPLLNCFIWVLVNIFFRDVAVVGAENIPKEGPIIFYGNHQNQFMDAMMMRAHCGRNVRFIIAEKSMHKPIIGQFARMMEAVPVVRPQDVGKVTGDGKLVRYEPKRLIGEGTNFTKSIGVGDVIAWAVPGKERCSGQVFEVLSDTELCLTQPVAEVDTMTTPVAFSISKRIDHSDMYANVYGTLEKGDAIGIFPEGGSHDRTSLLPLKAGVALFTLGAAERGIRVKIVPVGLTYFYGHKFRSRAHIEFGEPMTTPDDLVDLFKHDKRAATGDLLKILDDGLRNVTVNVTDWATLKFLHSFRQLYQPTGLILETKNYLRLTRRLADVVKNNDDDSFAEFRTRVENYTDFCSALLVRDSQAATLSSLTHDGEMPMSHTMRLLFRRLVMLAILTVVLMPFFAIAGPLAPLIHVLAEAHAKIALAGSTVKVVAADVKASYKIVLGFGIVPLTFGIVSTGVFIQSDMRTAITVWCSLPVVMYVSLLLVQEWIMELSAALPLVMSMLSKHKQFIKLFERRSKLVKAAQAMAHKFDPQLDDEMQAIMRDSDVTDTKRQASLFSLRHQSRRGSTHAKRL